jgi:hypothetical protein
VIGLAALLAGADADEFSASGRVDRGPDAPAGRVPARPTEGAEAVWRRQRHLVLVAVADEDRALAALYRGVEQALYPRMPTQQSLSHLPLPLTIL